MTLLILHGVKTKILLRENSVLSLKNMEKIKPKDNQANQKNPNKGTDGSNKQYDQNQGNRGEQLNPNQDQKPTPPAKKE